MIRLTTEIVINTLEYDFEQIIADNNFLRKEDDTFTFIEKFIYCWMTHAKKNYSWHHQLYYKLTHSYQTVYAVSELLDKKFRLLVSQKNENIVQLISN